MRHKANTKEKYREKIGIIALSLDANGGARR